MKSRKNTIATQIKQIYHNLSKYPFKKRFNPNEKNKGAEEDFVKRKFLRIPELQTYPKNINIEKAHKK